MAAVRAPEHKELVRVLDPKAILDMAEERLATYKERDDLYDELLKAYWGKKEYAGGALTLAANSAGRPLLRAGESITMDRTYRSRRLAPIVDDFTALGGQMPTVRVVPPPGDQGEAKAERLTKYLISIYEISKMDLQQPEAAFWLSALGDAVYLIDPEPELHHPVWTTVSPRVCYPSWYRGYRRFEVYDLCIVDYWNVDDIRNTFNMEPESEDPEDCRVIIYTSPYQRTVIVGSDDPEVGPHVQWDLSFCPAQWAFNKVPGFMGMADIANSLEQERFLDWAFSVAADGIVQHTYPIVVVRNPMNVSQDQITIGPGAPPVTVQGDGGVEIVQSQGNLQAITQMLSQTLADINAASGTSVIRQEGQMKGSIQTGRAIHASQGPQATRIELKQQVLGAAIKAANSMTFAMQERAPYLKDATIEINGNYKGKSFREEITAKDIDGWHRTTVRWDALVGMNMQQKLQVAYEGKMARIWDGYHSMELMGIEDPIAMEDRIDAETEREAARQAKMQAAMQPQQPQSGGQGGGGGAPPPAQPGGQAAPPSPTMIMRPQMGQQQGGGGLPTGVPQGVTRDAVKQLLAKVARKLRGTVFAMGDLATSSQAMQITLGITDYRDHGLVLETVRPLDPKAKVRQVDEDKMPLEAVRIA